MTINMRKAMKRTVDAMLVAYNRLDFDAIVANRTEDYIHQMLPATLGVPALNNGAFQQFFQGQLMQMFKKFTIKPVSSVYDTKARKAVLHVMMEADTTHGPFVVEAVLMLGFDETGERMVRTDEFVDSAVFAQFIASMSAPTE